MTTDSLLFTQSRPGAGWRLTPRHLWLLALVLLVLDVLIVTVYWTTLLPWMQTWGASTSEIASALPGDDMVPEAKMRTTKGITVRAKPESIYPWLLQLGVDRGGMYSYDWLENMFGLKVHSADHIVPALQDVQTGDFWRFTPRDYVLKPGPGLYVRRLIKDQAVLLCFGMEGQPDEACVDTWQFVLVPQADGSTRLLLRSNMAIPAELPVKLTYFVQFIMERKMLLTIRDMAEGYTPG